MNVLFKVCLTACCLSCCLFPGTASDSILAQEATISNESAKHSTSELTIGSPAPPLEIEHWFSDGDGRFSRTENMEPGKVYVIEFWATWCGPCLSAMPHLSKLQEDYQDRGVQIISVSDEDQEVVEEFLARTVPGKEEMTYAQLTANYCLTTDPDKSVMNDYFRAAGQTGIPCAFVVGKTGLVEWIGHPMSMDDVLEQVVADSWDREVFAEEFRKKKAEQEAMMAMQGKLMAKMQQIEELLAEKKADDGIKLLDEMIADPEFAPMVDMIGGIKKQLLILFVGGEKGATALREMAAELKGQPQIQAQMAMSLLQKQTEEGPIGNEMLAAAVEVAEMAAAKLPKDTNVLGVLARLLAAHEKFDRAIEFQQKVVELTTGDAKAEQESYLDQLKKNQKRQDDK
jgi:thiol-disulfide isomerase/thioredoxin